MISQDDIFEYYRGYKVPKYYSIPSDYAVPDVFESEQTTQTTSEKTTQKQQTTNQPQKEWLDAKTAALITAGMIGLFGGVAIGRLSKKKKGGEIKNW